MVKRKNVRERDGEEERDVVGRLIGRHEGNSDQPPQQQDGKGTADKDNQQEAK